MYKRNRHKRLHGALFSEGELRTRPSLNVWAQGRAWERVGNFKVKRGKGPGGWSKLRGKVGCFVREGATAATVLLAAAAEDMGWMLEC